MPERPPRLQQVFEKYDPPLYFVTFNIDEREKRLIAPTVPSHSQPGATPQAFDRTTHKR